MISFGFAGAREMLSFGLLFFLLLSRLDSFDAAAGRKAVVGSSVFLDPGYRADLSNSDILWTFAASNKSPVTILDYADHRAVEPNEQFKSRLHFNGYAGSLMLNNLKPGDQGIYTINVDAQAPRIIELFLVGLVETEFYCSPGSSVSFPGVDEDQRDLVKLFLWEMSSGNVENGSRMGVLRFHAGDTEPSLLTKYIGRLDFTPSNGSFVLHNLTYEDEGVYTLSINLPAITVRTVRLCVIDKLSKPSILSNSSSLDSTVQLTCDLFGNPDEYQWQKDGGEISQHHRLINGNRSLIIPGATKGDTGTYTCIAINRVGSAQADYTLTISGVPLEQIVIVASIIGLILSSVSFFGLIGLCILKRESSQVSLRQSKRLFLSLFSSNTLSLVATFIALVSWIAIKGAASVSVGALCIVSVLLVLAVIVTIAIWNLGCPCLQSSLNNTGFRASIDFCGIMCSFIVVTVSIVILTEEIQQNNQGCQSTNLTWSTLIPLLVILVIFFTVFNTIWCCTTWIKQTTGPLSADPSVKNPDDLQHIELFLNP